MPHGRGGEMPDKLVEVGVNLDICHLDRILKADNVVLCALLQHIGFCLVPHRRDIFFGADELRFWSTGEYDRHEALEREGYTGAGPV